MGSPPQGYVASSVIPSELWYDVRDYGAVSDPTFIVDSAPAIQAAINAALSSQTGPSPGGAVVAFPPGQFNVGSTSVITTRMDGVMLQGAGMGATNIRLMNTKNVDMFQFSQTQSSFFLGMRDLTLDGNYTNNLSSGNCVQVTTSTGASDLIFERVFFKNARNDGCRIGAASYSPSFINCISEFNQGYGLNIIPNICRIIGGKFQSDGAGCIYIQGGSVRKNTLIDSAFFLCDAATAAIALRLNCSQTTVTGCHITNGASNTGDLVAIDGASDLTLSGNMLVGAQATGYAINVTAAGITNLNIHDNDLIGTFHAGKINLTSIASGSIAIRHNWGYNPFGIIASPFDNVNNLIGITGNSGTLTSAKTYTCTGTPLDVAWTGGTVTAQTKNGTAIPALAAASDFIHLEPGDTYSITFSVTPTTFDVFGL